MQTTKSRISATRAPMYGKTQTPVASKLADCFRANVTAQEVYHGVRMDVKRLRRAASKQAAADKTHTCMTCAVRTKCSGFSPYRTAACAGKVEPLPMRKIH